MKVSVKTPATIANLGCGFDSFGLALPLYNIVSVEETVLPGSGIEINILNEKNNEDVSDIPTDKNNIVYKAIELLYNFIGQIPNELKITIKTQIPISRGLGSSASVIVGGLIAANELLGRPADENHHTVHDSFFPYLHRPCQRHDFPDSENDSLFRNLVCCSLYGFLVLLY